MKKSALRLAIVFASIFPAIAFATCNPFVPNTVLTASALNAGIASPCITSGTITGATISGVTLDSTPIGSTTPGSGKFTYLQTTGLDPSGYVLDATVYGYTGLSTNASIALRAARGTSSVPTATQAGDLMSDIAAYGYNGSAFGYGADVTFSAAGAWSVGNTPTQINFDTVPVGSATIGLAASISSTGLNVVPGILAQGAYTGTYTDGTAVDYATGNGRISVGATDTLTLYNGGVANTQMARFASTGATVNGLALGASGAGTLTTSVTAPTIASGFGTTPSIVTPNGTATFRINVGTGGTATGGVVTMPAATTGWACTVTPVAAPQAAAIMYSAPTSTTSITITNYTLTTGAALAWTASTVIQVNCVGY